MTKKEFSDLCLKLNIPVNTYNSNDGLSYEEFIFEYGFEKCDSCGEYVPRSKTHFINGYNNLICDNCYFKQF